MVEDTTKASDSVTNRPFAWVSDYEVTAGPQVVMIRGISFRVVNERKYVLQGRTHTQLTLQRPHGKRQYTAVRFDDGRYSRVVG